MITNKQNFSTIENETKTKVLVILSDQTVDMADQVAEFRSTPDQKVDRSRIIRKWIREGYRREVRRIQQKKQVEQVTA